MAKHYYRPLAVMLVGIFLAGCASNPDEDQPRGSASEMYAAAKKSLDAGNYRGAITRLERLETRYPFGEFAQQGRLDLIHAYYKAGDRESAVEAAEQFIRENPRHPSVDYAYYMKGVVEFRETDNFLTRTIRIDTGARPPAGMERSFTAFSQFLLRFPDSEYAPDARQRMIHIRNRLAEFEYKVASYYLGRGAYVAAVNRAKYVLENYQQSTWTPAALALMVDAYRRLGMEELATETEAVLRASYPDFRAG
jgi:outer membrane protein assembly factor BamD